MTPPRSRFLITAPPTTVSGTPFDVTIAALDAKGNIVPGIAEKIETSKDATSFKLTLRSGVKFADGTAYDAGAVVKNLV